MSRYSLHRVFDPAQDYLKGVVAMKGKFTGAVIGVALLAAAPATALAVPPNEPNGHASCIGTLSVSFQAHPEIEGSRSDHARLINELAAARGLSPGEIYRRFAHLHGTLEQCP